MYFFPFFQEDYQVYKWRLVVQHSFCIILKCVCESLVYCQFLILEELHYLGFLWWYVQSLFPETDLPYFVYL